MDNHLVQKFVRNSVATATARMYDKAFNKWAVFAAARQWVDIPADPAQVAIFIAHEGRDGASVVQISTAAAAVAHRHAQEALPSPIDHATVRKVLAGVKRTAAKPAVQRMPLSFKILEEVGHKVREDSSLKAWRTFWRMNIEFYALLRWEEVAVLRISDLSFHNQHMDVNVSKSKTDQMRQGANVRVARQLQKPHACPVNIILVYIRMLKYPAGFDGSVQPRILFCQGVHKGSQEHVFKLLKSSAGLEGAHS